MFMVEGLVNVVNNTEEKRAAFLKFTDEIDWDWVEEEYKQGLLKLMNIVFDKLYGISEEADPYDEDCHDAHYEDAYFLVEDCILRAFIMGRDQYRSDRTEDDS